MDTKNTQPDNAGTANRNPQGQSKAATSGKGSSADYASADSTSKTTGTEAAADSQQPEGNMLDSALGSGKAALESGKKWIADSGISDTLSEQTQNAKEWGNRAVARVGNLSTTQKVVGGALLAVGLGWLTLGGKNKKKNKSNVYGREGKSASGYGRQPGYRQQDDDASPRSSRKGVLSSMPSFGGSATTPDARYDKPSSGPSASSTVSDNVSSRNSGGSGYRADA